MLAIDGAKLQKLALRLPALAFFLMDSLSFKLHWVSLLLQTLGTEFVHCRVATLLMRLAELYGEPREHAIVIRYTFTQSDLAAMVGATRQGVSTALGRLRAALQAASLYSRPRRAERTNDQFLTSQARVKKLTVRRLDFRHDGSYWVLDAHEEEFMPKVLLFDDQ